MAATEQSVSLIPVTPHHNEKMAAKALFGDFSLHLQKNLLI